jgi:imidazolonepropionase-like amidohydrolase
MLRFPSAGRDRAVRPIACDAANREGPPVLCECCGPAAGTISERGLRDLSRRYFLGGAAAMMAPFAAAREAHALTGQPAAPDRPILFTNLKLFDGVQRQVRQGVGILVKANRIEALPGASETMTDARVIDCGGRLAMPGLIDAHWHTTFCGLGSKAEAMTADLGYVYLVAAREAERTLMRGFTTVRDAGGPSFGLKRAIDRGVVNGPRIYPAGAMISQTSGHGDFRMRNEVPRGPATPLSYPEAIGVGEVADGEAEVLRRVREQLMLGASQIKLMAGGGIASPWDPIDSTQYTERELRAAVEAADDWNTYVMVHVYTPRGIQRAIRAGVKCIEHGQLTDEETVRVMAGEGAWWSLQPFLGDEDENERAGDAASVAKSAEVTRGTERAYGLSKRYDVRTAWGTDILFTPRNLPHHARQLAKLTPRFYEPLELLAIATGTNGELMRLCGPRNPYPGNVGVIAPGAMADILIAEGDPTRSLDFLMNPEDSLKVIMKDGRIYKEALS